MEKTFLSFTNLKLGMKLPGLVLTILLFSTLLTDAQTIGTGLGYHTIVTKSDGTTYTWGYNNHGELGNYSTTQSSIPAAVDVSGVLSGKTIKAVAAGGYHSIALASDGTVYTWGYNNYGQLGNNSTTQSTIPVAVYVSGVLSGKTIKAVAAGSYHSIALASDGTVYTWGYNCDNETYTTVPIAVDMSGVLSGKTITAIAAGATHSIVLASDGTVYTWGENDYGQLGNMSVELSKVPVAVYASGILSGKTITAVTAGATHSIVLASDGKVYTWGRNNYGQLGINSYDDSHIPVAVYTDGVLSGKTITMTAGGFNHSIALASDGTVYTWGGNDHGELGNNSTAQSAVPVAVDQSSIGALPVELTSFSAVIIDNTVKLTWQTATELNNYGFEIERRFSVNSDKLSKWETIAFVEGSGNSNSPKSYGYVDNLSLDLNLDLSLEYRLKQIDNDGNYEYYSTTAQVDINIADVNEGVLPPTQNYPNPFNPTTTIKYHLPEDAKVKIRIYNILGQVVQELFNNVQNTGNHQLEWTASQFASGVYFCRIEAINEKNNFSKTIKMLLLK